MAAHHDDGNGRRPRGLLQGLKQLATVDARQRGVTEDDRWKNRQGQVQSFFCTGGDQHVKAGTMQNESRDVRHLGIIFNNKDYALDALTC